jgi:ketosteroid isomerase-like protein
MSPVSEASVASTVASATEVVARFNAAWSAHDLPAALDLTGEDCVFEATSPAPGGERCVGRAALAAAWKPVFDDTASRFTVEESFTVGPRVVQRWRYDWADGYVRGVDVYRVADGLITEKLAYVKG